MKNRSGIFLLLSVFSFLCSDCTERDFLHPFGYQSLQDITQFSLTSHEDSVMISWNPMKEFIFDSVIVKRTLIDDQSYTKRFAFPKDVDYYTDIVPLVDIPWIYTLNVKIGESEPEILAEDTIVPGPLQFWAYNQEDDELLLLSNDMHHLWYRYPVKIMYPTSFKPLPSGEILVYDRLGGEALFFNKNRSYREILLNSYSYRDVDLLAEEKRLLACHLNGGLYFLNMQGDSLWVERDLPSLSWIRVSPSDQQIYAGTNEGEILYLFKSVSGIEKKTIYQTTGKLMPVTFPDTCGIFLMDYNEGVQYFHNDTLKNCWEINYPISLAYDWKNNKIWLVGFETEKMVLYLLGDNGSFERIADFSGFPLSVTLNPNREEIYIGNTNERCMMVCDYHGNVRDRFNLTFLKYPAFLYAEH